MNDKDKMFFIDSLPELELRTDPNNSMRLCGKYGSAITLTPDRSWNGRKYVSVFGGYRFSINNGEKSIQEMNKDILLSVIKENYIPNGDRK